jgi:hypothetical protein
MDGVAGDVRRIRCRDPRGCCPDLRCGSRGQFGSIEQVRSGQPEESICDPRFWRLSPLSAVCVGTAWSLQGLWVSPWLTDVEGFDRTGVIRQLLFMALALSIGALAFGMAADRLRCRGIGPQSACCHPTHEPQGSVPDEPLTTERW